MLTQGEMSTILLRALSAGGDFSELFLEDRSDTSIRCVEGSVSGVVSLHIHGSGIRVLDGIHSVYVYTNDTSFSGLLRLADMAAGLLPSASADRVPANGEIVFSPSNRPSPNPVEIHPRTVDIGRKIAVLREMDSAARSVGSVRSLTAGYFDSSQHIIVANSEGLLAEDDRVRTRVRLQTTVERAGRMLSEFDDFVGPRGFELFAGDYAGFARNQVVSMKARLAARPARSCVVPVVIEGGSGGVLWHEACGHPLEADNVVTGKGEFAGRIGQRVASPKVTLMDDGSIPGMDGSEAIDDEGNPTRQNLLIENGILRGYLCDRRGARQLGMVATGSGRRQGYSYAPTSRMHNTFLAAGSDDEDEMIRSVPEGLYVKELGGGSGGADFSIEVKEAFWIRNGMLTDQVRGITLSGNSLENNARVDRVGRKLIPETGGSFCGGPSGLVPTTAFQPRIRISEMTVGGAAE